MRGPSIRPVGGAGKAKAQSPNPQGDSKKQGHLLRDLERTKLELDAYGRLILPTTSTDPRIPGDAPVIGTDPDETSIGDRIVFYERQFGGFFHKVALGVDADRTMWFQSTGDVSQNGEEGGFDWYCSGASTTEMLRRLRLTEAGRLVVGTGAEADAPFVNLARITCDGPLWVGGPIATDFVQVSGGPSTVSVSASFSIGNADTGAITFELPAAGAAEGYELTFKRVNAAANNVIVDALGADLIDGAANKTLGSQYAALVIKSDGVDWHVISTHGTVT